MSLLIEIPETETVAISELPVGDYKFMIMTPSDPSKAETVFMEQDEMGNPVIGDDGKPKAETRYLNWPLQVVEGPQQGRYFFHRTMLWASPEKISQSEKGSYDPSFPTFGFLNSLGFCDTVDGKFRLKAELYTKSKSGKASLRIDKIYGTVFFGRLSLSKVYKGKQYVNLTKSWLPKATDKLDEEISF